MANGHGGQRTPAKPAPVSGPGALSKRTDGGPGDTKVQAATAPTGLPYGDHQQLIQQQGVQPLSKATLPPAAPVAASAGDAGAANPTPPYTGGAFGAPSSRPGEPITTGVAIGPGAGPEAMTLPQGAQTQATGAMTQMLSQMSPTDTTGLLGQLYRAAQNYGV